MGIMTTGMHHTDLFALEGAAIGLLHRKSVDVGPEDDCLSAAPAMNFRVDSTLFVSRPKDFSSFSILPAVKNSSLGSSGFS